MPAGAACAWQPKFGSPDEGDTARVGVTEISWTLRHEGCSKIVLSPTSAAWFRIRWMPIRDCLDLAPIRMLTSVAYATPKVTFVWCNLKSTKWPIPKLGVIGRQLVRVTTEADDVWPLRLVTLGRMTFEA